MVTMTKQRNRERKETMSSGVLDEGARVIPPSPQLNKQILGLY